MKLSDFDLKTVLLILIGVACAVIWIWMAVENPNLRGDLLGYVKEALIFLVGLVLEPPTRTPNP